MIRTLRALFLRCLLREKLLVVVFLAIAVLLWLSGFSKRAGQFFRDKDRTHLRDLLDVGLIDATWLGRLPAELAGRLKGLIETPEG